MNIIGLYFRVHMKNRFLIVVLASLFGAINAHDSAEQLTVALAQTGAELYLAHQAHEKSLASAKNYRKRLYWLFENNPLFYKLDGFQKDLDYYIALLTDHITILERKIILKENGLRSSGMRSGALGSAISIACGAASYICFAQSKKLSIDAGQGFMIGAVNFGLVSALFAAVGGNQFYKISRYQERLIERLERDKKILAVLQKEKSELNAKKASDTAEKVNNGLNAIVAAVTTAIQGSFGGTPVLASMKAVRADA